MRPPLLVLSYTFSAVLRTNAELVGSGFFGGGVQNG